MPERDTFDTLYFIVLADIKTAYYTLLHEHLLAVHAINTLRGIRYNATVQVVGHAPFLSVSTS